MADQGFTIHGKFYPFVAYEDWLNQDFVLAWKLTEATTTQLFADPIKLEQALVAVAVKRATGLDRDDVIALVGALRPDEVEDVGFSAVEAPSPLDVIEPNGNGSSSNQASDESTVANLESSKTAASGSRGSEAGIQA